MVVCLSNVAENVREGIWNYALQFWHRSIAFHGKSFACASLTICKNGTVVAFKDVVNGRTGHSVVDIDLEFVIKTIQVKGLVLLLC